MSNWSLKTVKQVNVTDLEMIKWTWDTLPIQFPACLDVFQGPC